jgi:hypothetical protein
LPDLNGPVLQKRRYRERRESLAFAELGAEPARKGAEPLPTYLLRCTRLRKSLLLTPGEAGETHAMGLNRDVRGREF